MGQAEPCTNELDMSDIGFVAVESPGSRVRSSPSSLARNQYVQLGAVLFASTAFHLWSLLRTPAPFGDESNLASQALGLINTGRPVGPLQVGTLERIENYWTFFPTLGIWFDSIAIRALGLNLFAMRFVSIVFGLLLLAAIYVISTQLAGHRAGIICVLITSISSSFVYSSHLARHDIVVAAFGFGAIALFVTDRRPGFPFRSVLSGLLIALATEVHPNALLYGSTILTLHLVEYGRSALRLARFWAFASTAALGLVSYFTIHVLPDPRRFETFTAVAFGTTKTPPALALDPGVWVQSLGETAALVFALDPFRVPILVLAIVVLARRKTRANAISLALLASLVVGMAALFPYKPTYYRILVSPAADLVLAGFLAESSRVTEWHRSGYRVIGTVVVVLFLQLSTLFSLNAVRSDSYADFALTIAGIREATKPGSSLIGDQTFWIGLPDHPFLSFFEFGYYRRLNTDGSVADVFDTYHPDYLIQGPNMDWNVRDTAADLPHWARAVWIPRKDLDAFLEQYGRQEISIDTESLGRVRVTRIVPD